MSTTSLPRVRRARVEVDFTKTGEWLERHRQEYLGKWVVLSGDQLIGFGDDPRPIVEEARSQGVKVPFVELIRDNSEPSMGGWL